MRRFRRLYRRATFRLPSNFLPSCSSRHHARRQELFVLLAPVYEAFFGGSTVALLFDSRRIFCRRVLHDTLPVDKSSSYCLPLFMRRFRRLYRRATFRLPSNFLPSCSSRHHARRQELFVLLAPVCEAFFGGSTVAPFFDSSFFESLALLVRIRSVLSASRGSVYLCSASVNAPRSFSALLMRLLYCQTAMVGACPSFCSRCPSR